MQVYHLGLIDIRGKYGNWRTVFIILVSAVWLHCLTSMIAGHNGLIEREKLRRELSVMQKAVLQLEEEKIALERRNNRLYVATLDKDLLEEQARVTLGYYIEGEERLCDKW